MMMTNPSLQHDHFLMKLNLAKMQEQGVTNAKSLPLE